MANITPKNDSFAAKENAKTDDTIDPNAVKVDDHQAVRDEDQTWVVAKDADGKDQRVKSEDYPKWEADRDAEIEKRR